MADTGDSSASCGIQNALTIVQTQIVSISREHLQRGLTQRAMQYFRAVRWIHVPGRRPVGSWRFGIRVVLLLDDIAVVDGQACWGGICRQALLCGSFFCQMHF